ncbi:MAG: DnaD domain protein [Clostridia bacterium]
MIIASKFSCPEKGSFRVPDRAADLLVEAGCPAVYLAVYLYALRQYQAGNLNISNDRIAEVLKLSRIDVVNAFLFYSSQGLLKIHRFTSVDDGDFDIEFCFDDTAARPSPLPFRPSYKASEISRRLRENPRMSQMYNMVGQILGKTLSSADTELLYSFYDYYSLPVEVILVLIEYYASKGKRSMKYMEKEAGKWASAGIDTVEKAKAYIEKREEFLSYASRVRTLLGIQERRLSTRELAFINKWQNELNMPLDMVKTAFELTVNQTGKLSFAYMNKIMESWAQNNIRKAEDVQKKEKPAAKESKTARYDFDALQRRAFEAVNRTEGRKENHGI